MTRTAAVLLPTLALIAASLLVGCESDTSDDATAPQADTATTADVAPADPAPPEAAGVAEGTWAGTIDYQGYDVTFTVTGGQVSELTADLLADCDGDGYTENTTVYAGQAYAIGADGTVSGESEDTYDQTTVGVQLEGSFSGSTFTGFLREVDTIDGVGVTCDTLERTFTATLR